MQPGRQWEERINIWLEAIKSQIYKPLGDAPAEYFLTFDQLKYSEAMLSQFSPINVGEAWGKKWEYAWFKAKIELSKEATGKRIVCIPDVGTEAICFVKTLDNDYIPRGAFDKQHKEILLSRNAKEGECFELLLEAYAGHGPRLENGGPYPMEVIPVPEASAQQCKMGKISYGIWQEEAYQLYIDAFVLWDLYKVLDAKSLRAMKILEGLKQMTYIADVELCGEDRIKSFIEARKILAPLLDCKNGDSTPTMYICGQSHLDLAWLWTINETKRKSGRTYSNQLTLMEEYPDYKYFACDPYVLKFLKKFYPETYAEFLKRVAEGRIALDGGTYVEPDLNIPCGEALIRHFVYGKEAFLEIAKEAGIDNKDDADSKMLWLPDVFGFPGSIPQIMKLCGLEYFSTQKLMRSDPETEPFPYNNFIWEGNDGSQVLGNLHMKNNTRICPKDIHDRWYTHRHQEEGIDAMLYTFGFGDGGGGPTRDMVEITKRVENLEGIPKTRMAKPREFFEHVKNDGYKKTVYRGELYLAWHRGTFTSQSEIKRGNRMAETALRECESFIAKSYIKGSISYEEGKQYEEKLEEYWDTLMYLQFHDVLPGTSIQKVNEDAKKDFNKIIKGCLDIKTRIANNGVTLKEDTKISNTKVIPFKNDERLESNILVLEKGNVIEIKNSVFSVVIEIDGTISSIISNATKKEFVNKPCNEFRMYKNVNCMYDAWEIGQMVYDEEIKLIDTPLSNARIVEKTPDKVTVGFTRKLNNSTVTQQIVIEADSPVIYFDTTIDWQERHKLLKVFFGPRIHTKEGIEEVQYGYCKRSFGENHQFEKDQYEVINHGYSCLQDDSHGMAILNDGKYGVKVSDKEISLSLLRAPVIPDMTADAGMHSFTYACMIFDGVLSDSDVVNKTRQLQTRSLGKIEALMNVKELYSGNNMTYMSYSDMIKVIGKNAVIDWIYLSKKQEGLIVLRIYESMNLSEEISIDCKFEYKKMAILDVYENNIQNLGTDEKITLDAFKVVTVGIYI